MRHGAWPPDESSVPANAPCVLGAVLNCSESRWPSHWCHSKRCLEGFVAPEGNVGLATFGSGDSLAGVVQDLAERGGPLGLCRAAGEADQEAGYRLLARSGPVRSDMLGVYLHAMAGNRRPSAHSAFLRVKHQLRYPALWASSLRRGPTTLDSARCRNDLSRDTAQSREVRDRDVALPV